MQRYTASEVVNPGRRSVLVPPPTPQPEPELRGSRSHPSCSPSPPRPDANGLFTDASAAPPPPRIGRATVSARTTARTAADGSVTVQPGEHQPRILVAGTYGQLLLQLARPMPAQRQHRDPIEETTTVGIDPTAASPPGSCPRGGGHRGRGLTCGRAGSRRRRVRGASFFSPAVPPACHTQRSPAVSSGQSR
jgi:hypothetical protein